jgi:1-aminocyclopropane-1-carboxylate deaminase
MQFEFISREEYRSKNETSFRKLKTTICFYLIPEGGTNSLAIKGCQEILTLKMLNLIIFVAP